MKAKISSFRGSNLRILLTDVKLSRAGARRIPGGAGDAADLMKNKSHLTAEGLDQIRKIKYSLP
jgi:hypothetical protein